MVEWDNLLRVDLRVSAVIPAEPFMAARRAACVPHVDFGPEIRVRKSSAQTTEHNAPEPLIGRRRRHDQPSAHADRLLMPQCLITGVHDADGHVLLRMPDGADAPGARLL